MMTREEWLNELTDALRPVFAGLGHPLPDKLRASCGWPSTHAMANKKGMRALGECWYSQCSADSSVEIFVSPAQSDGYSVAGAMAHELVHAANGEYQGHRGKFIIVAKAVGLLKPWPESHPSDELAARMRGLVDAIGPYPHATLDGVAKNADGDKKPGGTRLLKAECGDCGYTVRVTKKWLEAKGAPICPCNMKAMVADMPEVPEEQDPEDGEGERLAA